MSKRHRQRRRNPDQKAAVMWAMEEAERKGLIRKTGRMARLKDGTFGPVYESLIYEGRDHDGGGQDQEDDSGGTGELQRGDEDG
jgi:hypothetical protein